jgi:hypothetical protein
MWRAFLFSILFALARGASAIGGGVPLSAESYPYSAFVVIEVYRGPEMSMCTGFLLNASTVVTSARCFAAGQRPVSSITLYRSRDLDSDRANRVPIAPGDVVLHPEFIASKGARREWAVIRPRQALAGLEKAIYAEMRADTRANNYGLYGYGLDENIRMGTLRRTHPTVNDIEPGETAEDFRFAHAKGAGLCAGDAGGPVYVSFDNKLYVVGMASPEFPEGGGACPGRSRVVKIAPVIEWLKGYVDGTAALPDDPLVPGGGGKP